MSANLHTSAVSFCPFSLSPGDHHATIVDIDLAHLIGEPHLSIMQPKAHRLNTQLPHTKACYLSLLEEYFLTHYLSLSCSSSTKMLPILPLTYHLLAPSWRYLTNSELRVCTSQKNTVASTWVPWLTLPLSLYGLIRKFCGAWSSRSCLKER